MAIQIIMMNEIKTKLPRLKSKNGKGFPEEGEVGAEGLWIRRAPREAKKNKTKRASFRFQGFGYGLHGGKRYQFMGSSSKGGQAGTECRRIGGHLPTLGTQEDVEAVQGLRGMFEYT